MKDAKILLLASEDQFTKLATQVFEAFPLQLFQADTLETALETARRERPELILFAEDLPGFDSAGGCAAFKTDDELRTIPLVVLASGTDGDAELFSKAGCDDYLVMPMDQNKFMSCLHQYIPCLERREERVPYYSQITIRDENEVFYGMTGDISGGGLYVATFDRLPAEGEIQLSFALPEDKTTLVDARGRVVWLNSKDRPISPLPEGFGVEFTSISREEYLAIKEYIAAVRKKTHP
jgi:CheY-like chemotaxis protein/Tfp pilus assembly protein PilZ